jgi:hypothetical protein
LAEWLQAARERTPEEGFTLPHRASLEVFFFVLFSILQQMRLLGGRAMQ